ncbi:MAG: dicarboxylate/amino acid:cation symporter [Bacteroidales bacterium]|nr:dicarboxylate/amino acid:cation symporter [Bacteroidales bacterium]
MIKGKKLALHWQILIGIVLGATFGIVMCRITPFDNWAPYISWAGEIFLRGLKMIVIPLVFSSIALGVAGMGESNSLGRVAGKTFAFYAVTTLIAATLGLVLVNLIKPGVGANLNLSAAQTVVASTEVSMIDQIIAIIPDNIFASLSEGNLLPVIFFAIIFGYFITKIDQKGQTTLKDLFQSVYDVVMKITFFIIHLAPFGVFSIVATVVGKQAEDAQALLGIAQSLGVFLLVIWSGMLLMGGAVLPFLVRVLARVSPWRHISKMSTMLMTAFSTCSSGAALPINIRDTQEKCGVSSRIANFTLPLGCTMNMNGTALYECVTAIFIAQAYGIDLTLMQQIIIVFTSLLSAIGAAGIPMAGMVMLTIVLNAAGLPLEGIGIVLAVEQLCDMPRTMINCYGDSCGAIIIAKSEGETLTV